MWSLSDIYQNWNSIVLCHSCFVLNPENNNNSESSNIYIKFGIKMNPKEHKTDLQMSRMWSRYMLGCQVLCEYPIP